MKKCVFCSSEFDETHTPKELLVSPEQISALIKKFPQWSPSQPCCSVCFESFKKSLDSHNAWQREEPTVVTTSQPILNGQEEEEGACLIILHGANLGKKVDLDYGEMILGRGENTHLRINEENISRQHAKFRRTRNGVTVDDLGSTNGTFVNTRRITSHFLRDGDLILVGNTILKFISRINVENQYYEEIYRLATMDGLTQVFNKSYFLSRLEEEFSRSRRYERNLSLIMFDFDHFHQLNNMYGHLAGDYVLRSVAQMILSTLRKEDVVGRYGGEEFSILLPEIEFSNVVRLAEKIRKSVDEKHFEHNSILFRVTISLGVAALTKEIRNTKEFIEKADQALYSAKAEGRNLVRTRS